MAKPEDNPFARHVDAYVRTRAGQLSTEKAPSIDDLAKLRRGINTALTLGDFKSHCAALESLRTAVVAAIKRYDLLSTNLPSSVPSGTMQHWPPAPGGSGSEVLDAKWKLHLHGNMDSRHTEMFGITSVPEASVLMEILDQARNSGHPVLTGWYIELLKGQNVVYAQKAAKTLGKLGQTTELIRLLRQPGDKNFGAKSGAIQFLAGHRDRDSQLSFARVLPVYLFSRNRVLRSNAFEALAKLMGLSQVKIEEKSIREEIDKTRWHPEAFSAAVKTLAEEAEKNPSHTFEYSESAILTQMLRRAAVLREQRTTSGYTSLQRRLLDIHLVKMLNYVATGGAAIEAIRRSGNPDFLTQLLPTLSRLKLIQVGGGNTKFAQPHAVKLIRELAEKAKPGWLEKNSARISHEIVEQAPLLTQGSTVQELLPLLAKLGKHGETALRELESDPRCAKTASKLLSELGYAETFSEQASANRVQSASSSGATYLHNKRKPRPNPRLIRKGAKP
ncbi:TPA: hypothetical protein HA318_03380 [Candidatus Micrarchaeota archaeon]|nr:hypothetical protein [Candidatus Micrarchaeota archaeon]